MYLYFQYMFSIFNTCVYIFNTCTYISNTFIYIFNTCIYIFNTFTYFFNVFIYFREQLITLPVQVFPSAGHGVHQNGMCLLCVITLAFLATAGRRRVESQLLLVLLTWIKLVLRVLSPVSQGLACSLPMSLSVASLALLNPC